MVRVGVKPAVRFFKILFGENITQHMYLPLLFARTVKHLTNKETQIEDASGQRWSVTLSRVNSSLAFQKGWPKFIQDHGLKVGELLVFAYYGSHFTVQIYTKSTLEKTNFNNEMPQPTKKRRRRRVTFSEDEPYQTADVNSGDKTISATLIPPGNEFQRRKTNNAMANADFEVSQPLPKAVNIEDPLCVFSRDDGCHEEHRNLLFDLSCFEMENRTSDANKFQKSLITELDNPHTETAQHDVTKNASDTKRSLSCIGIVEPTKPAGDDAMEQTRTTMEGAAVIETDVIMGDSGNISIDKFVADTQMAPHAGNDHFPALRSASSSIGSCKIAEREHAVKRKFINSIFSSEAVKHQLGQHPIKKECVMRESPEIAHQITKEVDDTQMAPLSGQAGGHSSDAFVNKSYEKPSDNSNIKKGMLDNVCNFQEGSGKIAEREHAVQSKFGKSIASSATVKHPLGGHPIIIKEERVENVSNQVSSGGKGQPVVRKHAPMISAQIKVEPGTVPSDTISSFSNRPFSAEVKSTLYLELPVQIIGSGRGISLSQEWWMAVFLRGPSGRLWPIIYQECTGGRCFTNNWTKFCKENNINPGDKCKFTVKDDAILCIYQVDVARVRGVVTPTRGGSFTAEMLDDAMQIS